MRTQQRWGGAKICIEWTQGLYAVCVVKESPRFKTKWWHLSVSLQKIQCKEPLFAYLNNKSPTPTSQMPTQHFAVLPFPLTGFSIQIFSSIHPPTQWQPWDWDMSLLWVNDSLYHYKLQAIWQHHNHITLEIAIENRIEAQQKNRKLKGFFILVQFNHRQANVMCEPQAKMCWSHNKVILSTTSLLSLLVLTIAVHVLVPMSSVHASLVNNVQPADCSSDWSLQTREHIYINTTWTLIIPSVANYSYTPLYPQPIITLSGHENNVPQTMWYPNTHTHTFGQLSLLGCCIDFHSLWKALLRP